MDELKSRLIEQEGMLVSPKTRHNINSLSIKNLLRLAQVVGDLVMIM